MPRPTRLRIKHDEESVNALFQEIYNDSHNLRAQINRLFTKWEQQVKENGEVAAVGEAIAKLIVAEAKTIDQKLDLLKYLKEIVFNKSKNVNEDESNKNITKKVRNELIDQVKKHLTQ